MVDAVMSQEEAMNNKRTFINVLNMNKISQLSALLDSSFSGGKVNYPIFPAGMTLLMYASGNAST